MKTKNAFRISFHMWPLLLKSLIAQMLILTLVVALCFTFFADIANTVIDLFNELGLVELLTDTISKIVDQTFSSAEFAELLENKIIEVTLAIEDLPNLFNRVEVAYFMVILAFCIYRMLISSADMTVAFSLKEFMTTNAKRPFIWYYVKKTNDSFKFVLLQFLIAFPLDLIIFFASCGFYLLFLVSFRWWTIYPAITIAIFMFAFRHAVFAFWLPSLAVNESSTLNGLRDGVKQIVGRFWSVFLYTVLVILTMLIVAILSYFYVPTALSAVVSSLVSFVGFFLLKSFNMVHYFEAMGLPYFNKPVEFLETEGKRRKRFKQL